MIVMSDLLLFQYGTTVGSGSGFLFGKGTSSCPTGAGVWEYADQVNSLIMAISWKSGLILAYYH